jgi:hypothetical protein
MSRWWAGQRPVRQRGFTDRPRQEGRAAVPLLIAER